MRRARPDTEWVRRLGGLWVAALGALVLASGCGPDQAAGRNVQAADAAAPATGGSEAVDDNIRVLLLLAKGSEIPGNTSEETRKNYQAALEVYEKILSAGVRGEGRRRAWLGAGRCHAKLGNLWQAYEAIERSFPPELEPVGVQERVSLEFEIAERLEALGAGAVPDAGKGEKKLSGLEAASRVLDRIVYNDPRSPEAPKALLRLGDCRVRLDDIEGAERAYRRLLAPSYTATPASFEARAALAKLLIGKDHGGNVPPRVVKEATEYLRECALFKPKSDALKARIKAARKQRVAAAGRDLLNQARFHLRQGNQKAGVFLLQDVLRKHPGTDAAREAEQILERLGIETDPEGGDGHEDE